MTSAIFNRTEAYDIDICVSRQAYKKKLILFKERNVQFLGIQHETDKKYLIFKRNNPKQGVANQFQINGNLIHHVEIF